AETAASALRDGLPSIASNAADEALAGSSSPSEHESAFTLKAAAQERILAPADFLAWLDSVAANAPKNPADYYRARALSALGRHAEAIPLLASLRSRLPVNSLLAQPALRDHAYALAAAGRPAEASVVLREAKTASGSDQHSITLDLAHLLLASRQYQEAIELLTPLTAVTNNTETTAPAALLLARAYTGIGASTNALIALAAIPAADREISRDTRATALAATALLRADAGTPCDDVLEIARSAIDLSSEPETRLECQGTYLRLLAQYDQNEDALELARRLVASDPRNPLVAQQIRTAAERALKNNHPKTALSLLNLHLSSFAADPAIEAALQQLRADAYARLDFHAEASNAFLRVAELSSPGSPLYATALYKAANEQRLGGFYRQATDTLARLNQANPDSPLRASATLLAAECLVPLDTTAAIRAFLDLPTLFPFTPEAATAFYRAAQLTASANTGSDGITNAAPQLRRAIELFRQASELNEKLATNRSGASTNVLVKTSPAGSPENNAPQNNFPRSAQSEETEAFTIQASAALSVAILQQRLGNFSEALASLDLAAALPTPGTIAEQAAALRPQTLIALGRTPEAIAAYDSFTNAFPHSKWLPDAHFWRASRAFNDGDFPLAAKLFTAFADTYDIPQTEWALHHGAVAAFRANRFSHATRLAARLIQQFPASRNIPAIRFIQAEANCQLLAFDEAALLFAQVAADPNASQELVLRSTIRRGDCLFTLAGDNPDRYNESIDAYRAALQLSACDALGFTLECHYKIARSFEKLNRLESARDLYYRTVILPFEKSLRPADAVWYARSVFAVADILRHENAYDQANAILRRLAQSGLPAADEAARQISLTNSSESSSNP
ncbi:MAG: hypothetical protein ACI4QT_01755, partial [Kiritimatiellia bacterium]